MEANTSLMEILEGIHDPRGAKGRRHPLSALLALAVVAMLAGMTSYDAIAQYGRERGGEFLHLLGFTRRRGLCKATYSRVFRRIDIADFELRVGQWIKGQLGTDDASHIAFDGKTARGSRDGDTPAIHLVAAYAPDVHATVAQLRVDAKTNEHKAALELLGILPLKGKVVTGDAMFTHRDVCSEVIEGEGDYIFPVKENQPTLRANIAAIFAEPEAGLSPPPDRAARSRNRAGSRDRQRARPNREADHRSDISAG
jgi:predicted transposase YbfD/YdcC